MKTLFAIILAPMLLFASGALAEYQMPDADKVKASAQDIKSLETFYVGMEDALKSEDIDGIMSFYADEYLHRGITKRQLRFMWLEIFNTYSDLYSIHVFSRIDVNRSDAILNCTGALMGVENPNEEYQAIDRWILQNHWVTKIGGQWKIVGGASHSGATLKGSVKDAHPLF